MDHPQLLFTQEAEVAVTVAATLIRHPGPDGVLIILLISTVPQLQSYWACRFNIIKKEGKKN
jgi:hypothetical protein